MKDWWLKLGCFLTGHNYYLVKNCSEASAKSVKKYTSAILIVSILWAFIGFSFAQRYLQTDIWLSAFVASLMVVIVVQIERQIILSVSKNYGGPIFRGVIALVMSVIGSVIIDQIIFTDDIEKKKIGNVQDEVDRILPQKTAILLNQISELDTLIKLKEVERDILNNEIAENPFIESLEAETTLKNERVLDKETGAMKDTTLRTATFIRKQILNPKRDQLPGIETQISQFISQKSELESKIITMRDDLEEELKSKLGFLDELTTLYQILKGSAPAFIVWLCFAVFFFALELFVLANKLSDRGNDYDQLVVHQRNMKEKMIARMD